MVAIEKTGYYPQVVSAGVRAAVAGEEVTSFLVHHEPTIDRDEVRRHITVVVLTGDPADPVPHRRARPRRPAARALHLDLDRGDPAVVGALGGGQPDGRQPGDLRRRRRARRPSEAVLTVGWGGINRIDLEPAACADPECEADHGYTGVLASDDFSLRVSSAADGQGAVDDLLDLRREPLRPHPGLSGVLRAAGRRPGFVEPDYSGAGPAARSATCCPRSPRALGVPVGFHETSLGAAARAGVRRDAGRRPRPRPAGRAPRPGAVPPLAARPGLREPAATCGVPSTTATSLTSLGTALTPGQHGLVGFTSRVPETRRAAQLAVLGPAGRPAGVAAARDRVRPARGGRRAHQRGQQAGVRGVRADPVRPARCGVRRGRRRRRADRRRRGGRRPAAVADLRLRRRPRLARPPRRRRLPALARPAARHRRGRPGAARRAARRRAAGGGGRPRDGRLDAGRPTSTSTRSPGLRDGVTLLGGRGPVPPRLLPPGGRRRRRRDLARARSATGRPC